MVSIVKTLLPQRVLRRPDTLLAKSLRESTWRERPFNRLYNSLWSRHEISRRTKGRIYESVVRTILLYGCVTWSLRVEDQRRLEVFDNDCLRRILGRRRLDRVPRNVLRHQLHLRALPPVLLQRRLRWFGPTALRPVSEIIREVINPEPPVHWRKKRGGQL